MLDDKNSIDNLQSPSTYNQQLKLMNNNDYPNQQVQNQILPNQVVQYQMLPNQNNQYIILPNLNSQIQNTPQNAYGLPIKENIYNPQISDPILKKLEECISVKIYNDYNYYCGREQYKVTGTTKDGKEIKLFKIIESSGCCNKFLNSKFSKPMNLKFYSWR